MKLSIITINRNNSPGLKRTIESVLSQTFRQSFEYIVVDGASTDGSVELLHEYGRSLDKCLIEPDTGIYNAMNKGVDLASGEYCLFLNSGDNLHDNLAIETVFPQIHGEDIISGKMIFTKNGLPMHAVEPLTLRYFYEGSLPHNATFIRRQLLVDTPYDETLRIISDWKFFLETIVLNNVSYRLINNVISDFDSNGISSDRDLCDREKQKVLEELFPQRILVDYIQFIKGSGYENTTYDKFFIKLRKYNASRFIYALDVFIMKFYSHFKKTSSWANHFPNKIGGSLN